MVAKSDGQTAGGEAGGTGETRSRNRAGEAYQSARERT